MRSKEYYQNDSNGEMTYQEGFEFATEKILNDEFAQFMNAIFNKENIKYESIVILLDE